MPATFTHFNLRIINPPFDSKLTDNLIELNHLHKSKHNTPPWLFSQLKEISHIIESVASAKVEGNRTTLLEYIDEKIQHIKHSPDRITNINNLKITLSAIENHIFKGGKITHQFIQKLHRNTVRNLSKSPEKTPGAYRTWNVDISQSDHLPADHAHIQGYMDELLEFINQQNSEKYELIKIALVHHRFSWIHPFGNRNGQVVRLLTYALFLKYGFNINKGYFLNPTSIFCKNKSAYYQQLGMADSGENEDLVQWCEYVLDGVLAETNKTSQLLDYDYLTTKILDPMLDLGKKQKYINENEACVLKVGLKYPSFKASIIAADLPALSSNQITHLITKLKNKQFLKPIKEGGRLYAVNFINNDLMKCLVETLIKENFILSTD